MTAGSTSFSPISGRIGCTTTTATGHSATYQPSQASTRPDGASRPPLSTTIATAGSISTSGTTCGTTSLLTGSAPCCRTGRATAGLSTTIDRQTGCITTAETERSLTTRQRRSSAGRIRSGPPWVYRPRTSTMTAGQTSTLGTTASQTCSG